MKRRTQLRTIGFALTTIAAFTDAHAGPEITGIPRESVDKAKMERTRLSAQLCGPGWVLSDDREHTPASFLCIPIKPKLQCPPNTQVFEQAIQ